MIINFFNLGKIFANEFPASIPFIDMNLYDNPSTRKDFIEKFALALHEIGFCAIINTGFDEEVLNKGYSASHNFFKSPLEKKIEIYAPHLNEQRGIVFSENAQGEKILYHKEFVHFGRDKNLLPSWIDLENTMMDFITHLDSYSVKLQSALSLFMDQKEDYLEEITQDGACLLRVYIIPKIPLQVDFEQLNILI